MATQTYTVKSGDTLGKIAKSYGVGLSDISGYKSGNPDLILPGETLTVNPTAKSTTADTSAQGYASAVKDALGGTSGTTGGTKTDTSGTTVSDDYLKTLRDSISSAQNTVSTAATQLAGLKTKAYSDEYAASGLGEKKNQISSLDQSIADKKAERDAAVAKVRQNPGLSAALLTGTVSKLTDKANADINNLIQQRNGLAGDYNTGLTEVNNKVSAKVGDAETAYNAASKALESLTGRAKDYQSALVDSLKNKSTADYQDKQLAISLMNAETAAKKAGQTGSDLTLARDSDGNPLYWFDKAGNIIPLAAGTDASLGGGQGGYGSLDTGAAGTGNGAGGGAPGSTVTDTTPWYRKLLGFFGIGG